MVRCPGGFVSQSEARTETTMPCFDAEMLALRDVPSVLSSPNADLHRILGELDSEAFLVILVLPCVPFEWNILHVLVAIDVIRKKRTYDPPPLVCFPIRRKKKEETIVIFGLVWFHPVPYR